jgi:hypothetical protein
MPAQSALRASEVDFPAFSVGHPVHYEHGPALGDHPAGSRIDPAWLGALNADNLVSLVRDAARFVPEIAALAEPLIGEARL